MAGRFLGGSAERDKELAVDQANGELNQKADETEKFRFIVGWGLAGNIPSIAA